MGGGMGGWLQGGWLGKLRCGGGRQREIGAFHQAGGTRAGKYVAKFAA